MSGVMWWMAQQLADMAKPAIRRAFNPHPPGEILQGSCTEAVNSLLESMYPRWLTRSQIVSATGRPGKQVSWALHYLRILKRIEIRESQDRRSSLYLVYRSRTGGEHNQSR